MRKALAVLLSLGAMAGPARVQAELAGTLTVFHAGSLAVPFTRIAAGFMKLHPGLDVRLEAAGSRDCARKISELNRPCDVLGSADYQVIDQLLIPAHAEWNLKFAANEMAIVFHDASRRSRELAATNWFAILMDPRVAFGRANPDADPCGYRTVLALQLAERHYHTPGLAATLLGKDANFIRPKETDLLALLESNTIDYAFLYRSVAGQHGLRYLALPDAINLRNPDLAEHYRTARVELSGKAPGQTVVQQGEAMVYGITIPKNAPNPQAALAFVEYVLTAGQGMAIIEQCGQPSLVPAVCDTWDRLPAALRRFARKPEPEDSFTQTP